MIQQTQDVHSCLLLVATACTESILNMLLESLAFTLLCFITHSLQTGDCTHLTAAFCRVKHSMALFHMTGGASACRLILLCRQRWPAFHSMVELAMSTTSLQQPGPKIIPTPNQHRSIVMLYCSFVFSLLQYTWHACNTRWHKPTVPTQVNLGSLLSTDSQNAGIICWCHTT